MPKNDQRDNEPRVFRVTMLAADRIGEGDITREVTAAYYQHENGFVTFKDNDGQALYAVKETLVSYIERLRTHVILAIASEELHLVLDGLRMLVAWTDSAGPETADEATKTAYIRGAGAKLIESLERLIPIASERHVEDASSLPRFAQPVNA